MLIFSNFANICPKMINLRFWVHKWVTNLKENLNWITKLPIKIAIYKSWDFVARLAFGALRCCLDKRVGSAENILINALAQNNERITILVILRLFGEIIDLLIRNGKIHVIKISDNILKFTYLADLDKFMSTKISKCTIA